ncbi:indole-3-glycerol phosphate synthase TrpC [Staphylococcus argensis]|uniref:indole-3-glycerol phosphate synthase TrpC n=1 Tax=Staphylococcus argensis TaxID=1607738 RepID=UPI0011A87CF1|nr:indole-3-glycerol phosphate synthase TrpC [Staphylococcus argensis]
MTILDEIVEYKQALLAEGYYQEQLNQLDVVDVSHKQSYIEQLKQTEQLGIIAEIKSTSPSLNQILKKDLGQQVKDYERYGASAISVLTDERYFGGSFERLQNLTMQTSLPVLCKDFIIDPLQIDVAKRAGASMILLIVNILSDETLASLYQYATQQGLDVLVEVHDQAELARAHQLQPELIGVNNRDLRTFITDVEHTNQILQDKQSGLLYISESGIHSREDVEQIMPSGIDGLLIGEALMKCDDLSKFLPSLKLEKVK